MSLIPPLCLTAAALLVSAASLPAQSPPPYSVTFLGAASGVSALGETGLVVGQRAVGNDTRAWVASATLPLALLPLPAGDASSWALDVNEQGVIVGGVSTSISPEFSGRAAEWLPDGSGGYTVHELGMLPGHAGSLATAVNNVGDIVGTSNLGMFRYPVLFTARGGVLDLNPLGVFDPQALNDSRQMLDKQGRRLDLGTMTVESFGLPPGPTHYIGTPSYALNELGQFAGIAVLATSTSCVYQGVRHMDGFGWQVITPCGPLAGLTDLNDLGDYVYKVFLINNIVHLEGIGEFAPQQLIAPGAGPFSVVSSFGVKINDARQLAVTVTNTSTGVTGAALLTPIGVAQQDLGHGGPGQSTLSAFGGNLASGTSATLTLWGGPEAGTVFLVVGTSAMPTPFKGGTLLPVPPLLVAPLSTGPTGTAAVAVPGGLGPASLCVQSVHADASLPGGYGLSNAVKLQFMP